jgi:hypothetical protein
VTCGDQLTKRPGMIADVSLGLLYLILDRFLSWPTPLVFRSFC